MQMEDVRVRRPGSLELTDPGLDEPLVRLVVNAGEDPVRRVRAVLVGGLEGRLRGQRVGRGDRGCVVQLVYVEARVERPGVRLLARLAQRAAGDRDVPARFRQSTRQV